MNEQNYKNHGQVVPLFHGALTLVIIAIFGTSLSYVAYVLQNGNSGDWYTPFLFVSIAVAFMLMFSFLRRFVTKLQDRIIRAEENLRSYMMTGKPLDPRLTLGQIIGLRFASDEEYIALSATAIAENLSKKEIKLRIKNWKPDNLRV